MINDSSSFAVALKKCVEDAVGRKLSTPKDFMFLSEQIFSRLHVMLSPTTLKRFWGYLKEGGVPRLSTLNVLSQYVGYTDWNEFCDSRKNPGKEQSNFFLSRCLRVEDIKNGQKIVLTWHPDRKCLIEYEGNRLFKVLWAENTKLRTGDLFYCSVFMEGEPLYIDRLLRNKMSEMSYVAGKVSGIRFELQDEQV